MRINKADTDIALRFTEEKANSLGVEFTAQDLEGYKAELKRIAENSGYGEKDPIYARDFEAVRDGFERLIGGMADNFIGSTSADRSDIDILDHVMAANDYLFALTMKELNSPDISSNSYFAIQDVLTDAAKRIRNSQLEEGPALVDYFNGQRGINAKQLKNSGVGELIRDVSGGEATPKQIGQLYAEYKALEKRQAAFGDVWRFFHRKENEERGRLMSEMRNALDFKIPSEAFRVDYETVSIERFVEGEKLTAAISRAVTARQRNPEAAIGYGEMKNAFNEKLSADVCDKEKEQIKSPFINGNALVPNKESKVSL